jgi:hypothetical protein
MSLISGGAAFTDERRALGLFDAKGEYLRSVLRFLRMRADRWMACSFELPRSFGSKVYASAWQCVFPTMSVEILDRKLT